MIIFVKVMMINLYELIKERFRTILGAYYFSSFFSVTLLFILYIFREYLMPSLLWEQIGSFHLSLLHPG